MPSSTRPRGTSLGNYDMRCDQMLMTSRKLWKNSVVAGETIKMEFHSFAQAGVQWCDLGSRQPPPPSDSPASAFRVATDCRVCLLDLRYATTRNMTNQLFRLLIFCFVLFFLLTG
ncbi:cytosolic carboxypeptidase 2-like isoform X4 [Callithrix jacchus]